MPYKIDLNGQVALITGGFKGIGGACTRMFSQAGAQCVFTGRRDLDEEITAFQDEIEGLCGKRPYYIKADIGEEEDTKRTVNETIEKFGQLDIVIANAGGVYEWERCIRYNVYGTDWLINETIPYLKGSKVGGKVVIISSICILYGGHGKQEAPYIAAKAGEEALTRLYARKYAPDKIRINCVMPGPILTEGLMNASEKNAEEAIRHYEATLPLGKMGRIEDIAGACLFLCSDLSRYITAQTFIIGN